MSRILNYSSIVKSEGENAFYTEFFSEVNKFLSKYYGKRESQNILKALKKKIVVIKNMNFFCTPKKAPFEPSDNCYASNISLLDFIQRVVLECRELEEAGATEIKLTTLFVQAYGIVRNLKLSEQDVLMAMRFLLIGLCSTKRNNPFIFRIPDVPLAERIANNFNIKFMTLSYCRFLKVFFKACQASVNNKVKVKVEFLHVLVEDYIDNIVSYLAETFHTTKTAIKRSLGTIRDFTGSRNSEIVTKLEIYNEKGLDFEPILLTLKHIQKSCKLKTYGDKDVLTYVLRKGGTPTSFFNNENVEVTHSFISDLELTKELRKSYCEIEVDCSNYYTFEEASVAASYAVKLAFLKYRNYTDNLTGSFASKADVKVFFTNIPNLSTRFVKEGESFRRDIVSKYSREVTFCYYYDPSDCLTRFGFGEPKYLRVISDIHADHPKNSYYSFNFGSDFVINCGDIANDYLSALNWANSNMTRGIIVPGNHAGYDYPFPEENGIQNIPTYGSLIAPVNTRSEQLRAFSLGLNPQLSLLNNSVFEYQGITFLFTTLYTNFLLYGEKHKEECMGRAAACINDYKRIYKTTGGQFEVDKVDLYTPQDTLNGFEVSIKFLERELSKDKRKRIVVVSHFAPLPYSIDRKYAHDPLNPYFVNDLSELFEKYGDRIRLWCHGHIHSNVDYLYNGVRVLACPFGYGNENSANLPYKYGSRIKIADIKSNKPWKDLVKGLKEMKEPKL